MRPGPSLEEKLKAAVPPGPTSAEAEVACQTTPEEPPVETANQPPAVCTFSTSAPAGTGSDSWSMAQPVPGGPPSVTAYSYMPVAASYVTEVDTVPWALRSRVKVTLVTDETRPVLSAATRCRTC